MYKLKYTLGSHEKAVSAVSFSPCGKFVASASADRIIHIYSTETGNLKKALDGRYRQGLNDIIWLKQDTDNIKDSNYLAVCSDDRSITIWDLTAEKIIQSFFGHKGFVFCVTQTTRLCHGLLLSGSYDGTARLWDIRRNLSVAAFDAHSEPVHDIDCSPTRDHFITSGGDGIFRTWDLTNQQCLRTHVLNASPPVPATTVSFVPSGLHALIGALDSRLRLWDLYTDDTASDVTGADAPSPVVRQYKDNNYTNTKFCCSSKFTYINEKWLKDSNYHSIYNKTQTHNNNNNNEKDLGVGLVAAGSETGRVMLWDVNTAKTIQSVEAHDDVVLALDSFCHNNNMKPMIVSGGGTYDPSIKLWEWK